ncbi:uncharacterized protein LOC128279121 [Anopheles cruzii]|uniref:uncharacterized protein LOC128279121 n=1 Tax=Anopheles cruzii TaxID=68878 RepID=UPI0022EC5BF0|nr:uncharacterized protein LOC128279121 [Anopheles cruzii]
MRLPSESNSAADFIRGSFRSIRSRLSDPGTPPALPASPPTPVIAAPEAAQQPNTAGQAIYNRATVEVQPVVIRKTPKFPSRERHLAIRRKNRVPPPAPGLPELSPPASPVSCGRRLSNHIMEERLKPPIVLSRCSLPIQEIIGSK